ncbi:MAG: zinc ABC transporter substrate-binding protein [Solobacterium sp.]|nr:zinc ABC transporter substrate-binding protein [Solobacterium sp.]
MKRIIRAVLSALLALGCVSCGSADTSSSDNTIHIVTTIFPEYDWVKQILGENPADMEVTLLMSNGVDLHSFQPSAKDIMTVSSCDLFIYVGGESDDWVRDALEEAVNKEMIVINLLDVLDGYVREEETLDGMEESEEEEEGAYDEHVWLSIRNAERCLVSIEAAIEALDTAHAETYRANLSAYIDSLKDLDQAYEETVSEAQNDILLFADRYPFRYLAEDYGLTCFAAFQGCSAETEASFSTVTFLAEKVEEYELPCVLILETGDTRLATTILSNTETPDLPVLTLNSMQGVGMLDVEDGATYESLMEANLEVLKQALR